MHRRFRADKPNQLWFTDITQFSLPGFKCYFSVIIDYLDGQVVAAQLGESPDAELANATLEAALKRLKPEELPVLHSDCGCHYRWPGWIEHCQKAGIVRSILRQSDILQPNYLITLFGIRQAPQPEALPRGYLRPFAPASCGPSSRSDSPTHPNVSLFRKKVQSLCANPHEFAHRNNPNMAH